MKFYMTLFSTLLVFQNPVFAESTHSSKPSAKVFEEDSSNSVSGKVKVIREVQEETEVFLDVTKGSSGPFVLPQNTANRAALLKKLQNSQKPRGASVTISIDDQQRIKNVEESGSSKTAPNGGN